MLAPDRALCCRIDKKNSTAALSKQEPTRPIDFATPRFLQALVKSPAV